MSKKVTVQMLSKCQYRKTGPKTLWDVFHDLKNVKIAEKSLKIGQLLPILANFNHILATFYEFESVFEKSW
jgi:hypothetical protein